MERIIATFIVKSIKLMLANLAVMCILLFVAYVFKSEFLKIDLIPNFTVNPLEIARELI